MSDASVVAVGTPQSFRQQIARALELEAEEVGWVQSAAMLVRRRAAQEVGYIVPEVFVYSDETDFCKRLRDACAALGIEWV